MSTLYIRLPSKAAAGNVPQWQALPCPFALVSQDNAIERQGTSSLRELSDAIAKSQRVVAVIAASDVTLLRVQVPPLSPARLKAALPNLVEDQLLGEPDDCVIVADRLPGGMRTVAIIRRDWLNTLILSLVETGARHISALPAQLCLSYQLFGDAQSDKVIAAIDEQVANIDLTIRMSEQDGIGLTIGAEPEGSAASIAIQTMCALIPDAPITLYVPQLLVNVYQETVNDTLLLNERINVLADNWSRWISGANSTTLDLTAGLNLQTGPNLDWHAWRWPLSLAAAILIVNIAALNFDWWRMKSESSTLRMTLIQIYKAAYPKESVIIDPIAQMQQKIAAAKHDSGMASPGDFTVITAAFGEAWSNAATGKATPEITTLEYRESSLFIHFKPGVEPPASQVKTALDKLDMTLEITPAQSGPAIWKIRSAK